MRETFVLLPGLACDHRMWTSVIARISNFADCIVAKLPLYSNLDALAGAVLEQAPEKAHFVGPSMGGFIALQAYRQMPQAFASLTLMVTTAAADSGALASARRKAKRMVANGEHEAFWMQRLDRLVCPEFRKDPQRFGLLCEQLFELTPRNYPAHSEAIESREPFTDMLSSIQCPSLVIAGADDPVFTVEIQRQMAADIPGARFAAIPNCCHVPTMERPAETAWLLLSQLSEIRNIGREAVAA